MPKTNPERAKVDEVREARLRPILADTVRRCFGNNQRAAAEAFFVTSQLVNQVLKGKRSVSYPLVLGIARAGCADATMGDVRRLAEALSKEVTKVTDGA